MSLLFILLFVQKTEAKIPAGFIEHFSQIALGSEFSNDPLVIKKWRKNIHIHVVDALPSFLDKELDKITAELNLLIQPVQMKREETLPLANVLLFYGSWEKFQSLIFVHKSRIKNPKGYFFLLFNKKFEIEYAYIFINRNAGLSAPELRHVLREEISQSLGLMRDSWFDRDSIFFAGQSQTSEFTDLDRKFIRFLYRQDVRPGFKKRDLLRLFDRD